MNLFSEYFEKLKPKTAAEAREVISHLMEITYWLLLFEGALRKWVLPFLSKPLLFVREPFVLYMLYLGWVYRLYPTKNKMFQIGMILSLIWIPLLFFQFLRGEISIFTGLYGWKMYYLYLPLTFLAAECMTRESVQRLVRRTTIITIPMAVLTILQNKTSPDSYFNKTIDDGAAFMYGDCARASGTFSCTAGHMDFCMLSLAMIATLWLLPPKQRLVRRAILIAATISTAINILLDGNRGAYFAAIPIIALLAVFRFGIQRSRPTWKDFLPIAFCGAVYFIYPILFPEASTSMQSRMNTDTPQGHVERIISSFGTSRLNSIRLSGSGVGLGTSPGKMMSPDSAPLYEEGESDRLVAESGVLGLVYLAYRYGLAVYILVGSFQTARRTGNPLALLMVGLTGVFLCLGQITFNGVFNGFCWITCSLIMAVNRISETAQQSKLTVVTATGSFRKTGPQ